MKHIDFTIAKDGFTGHLAEPVYCCRMHLSCVGNGWCFPADSSDYAFYLVTLYCFARSSKRLEDWFKGTKLYKKHLESFVEKRGMLMSTKLSILITVTLLMSLGIFFMTRKGVWIPCIILGVVWVCHFIYFVFFVKTIKGETGNEEL